MNSIHTILRSFGISRCYVGYYHTAYAIMLAVEDDLRLQYVVKEIYMVTARHYHCSWRNVERNIRTSVERAWNVDRNRLISMAGYEMATSPSAGEFVEIIADYILRQQDAAIKS